MASSRAAKVAVWLLAWGGVLWLSAGQADERILSFHSDITVAADASMTVAETIRVRAEGQNIRRGIYRDFPTDYEDRFGNDYRVGFEVLGVTRDGNTEPYHTEKQSNGVRVYLGSSSMFLSPGVYTYVIRYRTDRQLGYFTDHDELYWNVTGNAWVFPIDEASATVTLPPGVPVGDMTIEGYTGRFGSTARDYVAEVRNGKPMIWAANRLWPGEGLTLVASWPKGHVAEPTAWERLSYLLADNRGLVLALCALVFCVIYLGWAWSKYGRDPQPGVIFPHYEPPRGYSPAASRFISRMGYDDETLTAAVINLAVKGYLSIDKTDDDYVIREQTSTEKLAPGEAKLYRALFADGPVLELDDENHEVVSAARAAHRKSLKRHYEKIYFFTNSPLLGPSLLLSILVGAVIIFLGLMTPVIAGAYLVIALLHVLFYFMLRAPTPRGRSLIDKLEGFRMYLNVAEKDDLNLRNPPDKTPELFEKYLPFALALGVEQAWARQFAGVFAGLKEQGTTYQPRWYHGDFNPHRMGNFASNVGSSLSSAISSAATPPGSSSGGGGGGSSGGGGGGGGGGGW